MKKYNYDFGEKDTEEIWDKDAKQTKELKVWQSPKYKESKAKAIEIISSGKYGVEESDFWILKNSTKTGKMAYTGLIISHNGCLKINDKFEPTDKFKPECLKREIMTYNNSLIYEYMNAEQGIYEVGEVTAKNCSNEYPFAMAFKRCFDRVILKISKLAYAGIYSDSEADEFANPQREIDELKKTAEESMNASFEEDKKPVKEAVKKENVKEIYKFTNGRYAGKSVEEAYVDADFDTYIKSLKEINKLPKVISDAIAELESKYNVITNTNGTKMLEVIL